MSFNENMFDSISQDVGTVVAANKSKMQIKGRGTATLRPACSPSVVKVNDVKLIPDLSVNLLSVGCIVKQGHTVEFNSKCVKIVNSKKEVIATGTNVDGLFKLDTKPLKNVALACSSKCSKELWHRRMGHLNNESLDKLCSGLATGIHFTNRIEKDCKVCVIGKQKRLAFNKCGNRANDLLELVHTDI